MPGHLFQGDSERGVLPRAEGLAARRCDCHPLSAVMPRSSRDSAMKPVLKRSHMEQPELSYRCCRCHMPQEPLKEFQWDRYPAFEGVQAVQHRLSVLLCVARCLIDRIQLHTEKRDPLHGGEFALLPVDRKTQLAEVPEREVPVFA
ncbi:hypothetical protein PO909_030488 [Leuciscus waleckii]